MKKAIIAVLLIVALSLGTHVNAQKFSGLVKSPADIAYFRPEKNDKPVIKLIYSRPQLKNRAIGVDLAPYGEVWRTGANEATEIKFFRDISLGETLIEAGTYSLFSIPGKNEWTIIINKDTDIWGSFAYKESNDVARIVVPVKTGDKYLESFSVVFVPTDGGGTNMIMGWGKVRVEVPFTYN